MISVNRYVEGVNSIYIEQPQYKLGHDGSDGYCDCIGMCKGAIRREGETPVGLSGTNYAARNTIKNLKKIKSVDDLCFGDVVLKGRQPGSSGYDLPDRYKGGTDLTDYYHIGTVTSTNPLEITHMTAPTAKKDTKLGNWNYYGQLPQVGYEPEPSPEPTPEPEPEPVPVVETAVVVATKGNTVNMRRSPSITAPLVDRIKIGETVTVLVHGEDWCQIKWQWKTGWMMTQFLLFEEEDEVISNDYTVTIPNLTKEQADKLKLEWPDATISVG